MWQHLVTSRREMVLTADYQGYAAHREAEKHACRELSRHSWQGVLQHGSVVAGCEQPVVVPRAVKTDHFITNLLSSLLLSGLSPVSFVLFSKTAHISHNTAQHGGWQPRFWLGSLCFRQIINDTEPFTQLLQTAKCRLILIVSPLCIFHGTGRRFWL